MEDIGKELCERVRAALEERNSRNAFMVRLKKEIAEGKATMRDTSLYSQTLGINLRRAIKEVVTPDELPDSTLYYNIAHSILEPLLRDTYEDVNAICAEVQRMLDDKAGIHLAPQKADFPAERVRAAAGSASIKDTAEHGIEVLERTSENITAAFSDDYMKANADFRARAGLDVYIERRTDGKCCPWCTGIAGRYQYGSEPHDIYRRHDNCGCTVECVSSRGRQNVWSKRWNSEPKKIEYIKPTVLTKEQAAELEKRLKLEKELTNVTKSDIIYHRKGKTHRHVSDEGRQVIDKPTYNKITGPAIKKGADIRLADDEWLTHLEKENARAVTIGKVIYFRPDATVSDVLEEVHHFYQNLCGLNDQYGNAQRTIMNEIDAKKYLLSMTEKYNIPPDEVYETEFWLKKYIKKMEEMKERGEWIE